MVRSGDVGHVGGEENTYHKNHAMQINGLVSIL